MNLADAISTELRRRNHEAVRLAFLYDVPDRWKEYAKAKRALGILRTRARRMARIRCDNSARPVDRLYAHMDPPSGFDARAWSAWVRSPFKCMSIFTGVTHEVR